MADPIDPNLNNSKDNTSTSQADIAKELSSVLDQVYTKLERINQLTRSQSDFITSMTQNFQIMQNSIQNMSENSNKTFGRLSLPVWPNIIPSLSWNSLS